MALLVILSIFFIVTETQSSAQDDKSIGITAGFTVDPSKPGQKIQPGSEIRQLENGVTEVYGPDGSFKIRASDSKSEIICTPDGKRTPANHVYQVPSGSKILRNKQGFDIYSGDQLIMKVKDTKKNTQAYPPGVKSSGWVESAHCQHIARADYFYAHWTVPSEPDNGGAKIYIFNSLQDNPQSGLRQIIQPVLERNYYDDRAVQRNNSIRYKPV